MAQKYNKKYGQWFSEFIGVECDLIYMSDASLRQIDLRYSTEGSFVSFADGYPILIATEQSLIQLNQQLPSPIDMRRFRPNIVISVINDKPFEEDNWKLLQIGDLILDLVKPCSRCVLTTVNPDEGVKSRDGEPLRLLNQTRKTELGGIFGRNAIPLNVGSLSVGDEVYLLEHTKEKLTFKIKNQN